jgi:hypothetical protein
MGDNEYVYENDYDPLEGLSEEERAAYFAEEAAELEEEDRQLLERKLKALQSRSTAKRIGRFLSKQPGTRRLVSRARGTLNVRRKANMKRQKIQNNIARARREYKEFINNAANERFFPNAHYSALMTEARAAEQHGNVDEAISLIEQIDEGRAEKASFKMAQLNALRQTLRNSAAAENARIYAETKTVLESEPAKHRQTVLKIAALDDLMLHEKKKLKLANTNAERERAATHLYNIEELKEELDAARHMSKVPTPEQNARYSALVAGVDFESLNSSLYPRLVANNAALKRKNLAATKIQTAARGKLARKTLKKLRNEAEERRKSAYLPMVPLNYVAPAPSVPVAATAAQIAEARAARLARFKKGGRTYKRKN